MAYDRDQQELYGMNGEEGVEDGTKGKENVKIPFPTRSFGSSSSSHSSSSQISPLDKFKTASTENKPLFWTQSSSHRVVFRDACLYHASHHVKLGSSKWQ